MQMMQTLEQYSMNIAQKQVNMLCNVQIMTTLLHGDYANLHHDGLHERLSANFPHHNTTPITTQRRCSKHKTTSAAARAAHKLWQEQSTASIIGYIRELIIEYIRKLANSLAKLNLQCRCCSRSAAIHAGSSTPC
jgi:hypothetical protein